MGELKNEDGGFRMHRDAPDTVDRTVSRVEVEKIEVEKLAQVQIVNAICGTIIFLASLTAIVLWVVF